jgi:hypothetical protein
MQFNDGSYEAYTVTGLRLIGIHATMAAAAEQIAEEIGREAMPGKGGGVCGLLLGWGGRSLLRSSRHFETSMRVRARARVMGYYLDPAVRQSE